MSPLNFFRKGPPPPRVALLPDELFFVRAVPVPGAAGPEPAAVEVAAQVELALESVSPFPLTQLYYGYFWLPGSGHALAFASYRRRFTAEQVAAWEGAEVVLPAFAAILGVEVQPATTVVLSTPEGFTGVYWGDGAVPTRVIFQPLVPEATDDDRERARAALLRSLGDSKAVVDVAEAPAPQSRRSDREMVFNAGSLVSRLSAASATALDVRDKEELVSLRRAHRRDTVIWRVGIGSIAAFGIMAVCELGLIGGGFWQTTRLKIVRLQTPVVDNIMTADDLAHKIDDLSTKRLLPIEMIQMVHPRKFGTTIYFLSASTNGLYTLSVAAQTSNPGEISVYQNSLEALPACEKVEVKDLRTQNNVASFTIVITFKPEALKPGPAPSAS